MERNPNDGFGTNEPTQSGGSGAGLGGSGTGYGGAGTGGVSGGTSSGTEFGGGGFGGGAADRSSMSESTTRESTTREETRERLGQAKEQARQKLGQARERAGELKATLADKLDAGADRLRHRSASSSSGGTPAMAGAGVDVGTTEVAPTQDPMARVNEKLATGMKSTADWLRNNDLDSMKSSLEGEVRTNPGRSLLIAAVAGYLLGKAFRK